MQGGSKFCGSTQVPATFSVLQRPFLTKGGSYPMVSQETSPIRGQRTKSSAHRDTSSLPESATVPGLSTWGRYHLSCSGSPSEGMLTVWTLQGPGVFITRTRVTRSLRNIPITYTSSPPRHGGRQHLKKNCKEAIIIISPPERVHRMMEEVLAIRQPPPRRVIS